MFHTAIAETRGLSPVESKVLDYLARLGPQTPKDLARLSGLAPASVTALIDRLERKGFVGRRPHPDDRRRVLIALDEQAIAAACTSGTTWSSACPSCASATPTTSSAR